MTGLQAAILGGSALILLVLALRLGLQRHLPRRLFPALDRALFDALFDDRIGRVFVPADGVR